MTATGPPYPCVLLPGLVMPAGLRYAALMRHLGGERPLHPRDMAVATDHGAGYSIRSEVQALEAFTREHGIDRFHLYGHSAGGAVALAYAAAHPDRVVSLALDEAATDFSDEDRARPEWSEMRRVTELPFVDAMVAFRRLQVGPSVPAALPPSPPAWMAPGPERISAFSRAVLAHRLPAAGLGAFRGPVHASIGTLTNARFEATLARLERVFPDLEVARYEGLHHLHCAHQAVPEQVAEVLARLWSRAERG